MMTLSVVICHLSFSPVAAQTFTQRIQKQQQGQGTVTIHQSDEIEQLVNDPAATGVKPQRQTVTTQPQTQNATQATQGNSHNTAQPAQPTTSEETATADAEQKATPKNTRKVMGYRVQAYAGGNSRNDRQAAERTGNAIRSQFSGVPVYVHFYSPRWICRVGNYRTYEEAHQMMVNLHKMGYPQATIVRGKITVQY